MHFTTLVLTNEPTRDAIASMMAPYQQNNMGDCPEEYLEFMDETEDIRYRYEQDTIKTFFNGEKYVTFYDYDFNHGQFEKDAEKLKAKIEEKPIKDFYDFDFYCKKVEGYDCEEINGEKRYGYFENPNAEWDYWGLLEPEQREVHLKSGKPFRFPVKVSELILSMNDIPELMRAKFERVWEQVMEDAPLENGEPEVNKDDYIYLNYCKTKDEFIKRSTMGAVYNIYCLVSEDTGWFNNLDTEETLEILNENLDKYVSLVDCHM